jgi:hypothetical protein
MLVIGLAATLFTASTGQASAADHFVTSPLDDNSDGTLRKEVADAANGDTVIINPGVDPDLTTGVEITVDADITIRGQGPETTTVDAVSGMVQNRAFNVQAGVSATIENLGITGGRASDGVTLSGNGTGGDSGGAIRNSGGLTLRTVLIEDCRAGRGGNGGAGGTGPTPTNGGNAANGGAGGAVFSGGTGLTVIDSTFRDNEGGDGGSGGAGGTDTDVGGEGANGGAGGTGGGGGAIATADNLTVTGSTFEGNVAGDGGHGGAGGGPPADTGIGGPGAAGGAGGAVSLGGAVTSISNTTIADNVAGFGGNGGFGPVAQQLSGFGGRGGGIASSGTATVTHTTIAGNAAGDVGTGAPSDQGRGGAIHVLAGTTTLRNSILSANTAPVAATAGCNNTVVDGGNNLSPAGVGCPASFGTGNPMLSPLADNDGPTETMAISAAGAADDAVTAAGQNCAATDQRGVVRPQGVACDIGAFEITMPATLTVTKSGSGAGTVSGTGISCGADCTETVPYNTVVVLSAVAASGSTFAGWTGCDSPSGTTCTQTLGSNKTVTANFALAPVVTPPVTNPPVTPPATAPKKCKKGQKLKKGKCVKKKRKKKG